MAKDQQVVEAVLRDKDPEWFLAQGTEVPDIDKQEFNLVPLDLKTFIDFYVFY